MSTFSFHWWTFKTWTLISSWQNMPHNGNQFSSVGWTGYQSLSKKNLDTAEPQLMDGTLSLVSLFVKMTMLIREMAAHARFEQPFTDISGCFKDRSKYAKKIHPDNVVESMSILRLSMILIIRAQ
jgi:hypothetical protein